MQRSFTITMEDTVTLTLRLANKTPWRVQLNGKPTRFSELHLSA